MVDVKIDMPRVNAIAFDPYTHGYYKTLLHGWRRTPVSELFPDS